MSLKPIGGNTIKFRKAHEIDDVLSKPPEPISVFFFKTGTTDYLVYGTSRQISPGQTAPTSY